MTIPSIFLEAPAPSNQWPLTAAERLSALYGSYSFQSERSVFFLIFLWSFDGGVGVEMECVRTQRSGDEPLNCASKSQICRQPLGSSSGGLGWLSMRT